MQLQEQNLLRLAARLTGKARPEVPRGEMGGLSDLWVEHIFVGGSASITALVTDIEGKEVGGTATLSVRIH